MKKICNLLFNCLMIKCFLLLTAYSLLPTLLFAQSGWSEDMRLTYRDGFSYDPRAACCGDTVHLVWWEHYGVNGNLREEVFYKRSTDAGYTWEDDVRLTPEDETTAVTPSIAVWGNNVHIAWKEICAYYYAICYIRSTDGGDTWSVIDTLHKTTIEGMRGNPRLCVYKDTVYLVTTRDDGNVLFMKSINNGVNWDSATVIGDGAAHLTFKISKLDASYLTLAVAASYITEILFYKSTDAGDTWSDTQVISENDGIGSQRPALALDDSSGVHICWYDYKYSPYPWTGDIFYRVGRDSGNTWEEIDSLTIMHRAVVSDILAEGGNLHLVWEDDRNDFDENFEIYYRMSTNLGQSWDAELRLTDTLNWSRRPSLACAGQYLHLFWFDLRDDPSNIVGEIYYKRKNLSQTIGETNIFPLASTLKFDMYPNPFITDIRLQITDDRYKKIENVKIYDISGKEVVCYDLNEKTDRIIINTKDLPCGVYFVQIQAGSESGMKKVVKVK